MALTRVQIQSVEEAIRNSLRNKFANYNPEPAVMPFHTRLLWKDRLDLEKELKVAEEFWDFLGGEGAYNDLLGCFEKVGLEMRDEIDEYFSRYNKLKI